MLLDVLSFLYFGITDLLNSHLDAYANCAFYKSIEELTENSLMIAWKLIDDGQVPIKTFSNDGDTMLHFIVNKYVLYAFP